MENHEAIAICFKNNIKVYPVVSEKTRFQIEYSVNDVPKKRFDKVLKDSKEVNIAMTKTYHFLAQKLITQNISE